MTHGNEMVGEDLVGSFFRATANPFVGLILGVLATLIVQSSSVTTSLIVGLVAAPQNPLPLANAVPMVIGANFGTTVTNSIVALAHMGRKREFRRAFAVSTCDDFFELFAVVAVLPIELATGFLLSIIRGDSPLNVVAVNFSQMADLCLKQVVRAGEACFGMKLSPGAHREVYEWDIQVNRLEQDIRRKLIIHLAIPANYVDAPYCLLLMSVVKDVERIGGYAKNLLEVSQSSLVPSDELGQELGAIRKEVEETGTRRRVPPIGL